MEIPVQDTLLRLYDDANEDMVYVCVSYIMYVYGVVMYAALCVMIANGKK